MTPRPPARPGPSLKPATLRAGVAWRCWPGLPGAPDTRPHRAVLRPPARRRARPTAVRPAPKPEEGPRWQKLRPAQRDALKPLQQEWSGIDASSKQKWIQLADRMPDMHAEERSRVQDRMSDWAKLTPAERGQARLRYQEAKQVPPSDRRSRWDAYQALPPEQKNELAARAAAARKTPSDRATRRAKSASDAPTGRRATVRRPSRTSCRTRPIRRRRDRSARPSSRPRRVRRPRSSPVGRLHRRISRPVCRRSRRRRSSSTSRPCSPQRGPQGAAVRPAGEPPAPPRR